MQRRNIQWLTFALLALGAVATASAFSSPRRVTIELDPDVQASLEQDACGGPAESVEAIRSLDPPLGDSIKINCPSTGSDGPYPLASSVSCSARQDPESWQCYPPRPNVSMEADGRTFVIDYYGIAPRDAVRAVTYLLSEPSWQGIKVRAEWITSFAGVSQHPELLFVFGGGPYSFQLRRADDGEAAGFELIGISKCETDVCTPMRPEQKPER